MNTNLLIGSVVEFETEGKTLRGRLDRVIKVEAPWKPETTDESKWTAHVVVFGTAPGRHDGIYQVAFQDLKMVA